MTGEGGSRKGPGEVKPAAKPPAGGTAKPSQGRRPGEKPFVPFARFEDLVVRCGHVEQFGLLPDGKDRFREGRRQKAVSRDCKACREKKRLEQEAVAQQRQIEKEQRKAGGEEQRPAKGRRMQTSRLPDGAQFEVRYDAAAERWSGSLTIPTPDGAPATFTGSGSGLFPLLSSLDKQYRDSLS